MFHAAEAFNGETHNHGVAGQRVEEVQPDDHVQALGARAAEHVVMVGAAEEVASTANESGIRQEKGARIVVESTQVASNFLPCSRCRGRGVLLLLLAPRLPILMVLWWG